MEGYREYETMLPVRGKAEALFGGEKVVAVSSLWVLEGSFRGGQWLRGGSGLNSRKRGEGGSRDLVRFLPRKWGGREN